ncbi:PilC/PilY family type IV pilus protein [Myxococcus sp. MxC21-1]|uniref:PilC/PilY family type IV pilus protein n=1 Tax=Myxococcus sp. MxC21-1 TaxID=3041439 RepID=UPI00292E3456|nr:PilC/PilY family type IV pilus protein [Myxococcus sp. MxC21-1]WNZ62653.1 PilC/PilY family type IV pilus protein [Myxococcus sp. MxC21-1]
MRILTQTLAAFALLAAPVAYAQAASEAPAKLCEDQLAQNKQPEFSDENLEIQASTMLITEDNPARLQLNTNRTALNSEHIFFPFDQNVTISYVYESAGASHSLGYVYMDDLRERGYVDANGNLLDTNNNGILDLHEDLFNLAPRNGTKSRPYIGSARRCTRNFTSGGETYNQPELAMNAGCGNTFQENIRLADARPGLGGEWNWTDQIGEFASDPITNLSFSDGGLFPHLPNLLEPPSAANGNMGLGRMVFLLADDDDGYATYRDLAPVKDEGDFSEGIPDYDVSNYDPRGLPRAGSNPDEGITAYDRTVDMGMIEGGKEVIFFIAVYYQSNHGPREGYVFPCLKQDPDGRCALHLRTSINVFFSKSAWNMDQNPEGGTVVAERNIGCQYLEGCNRDNPASTPAQACRVQGTNEYYCGWLDGPIDEWGTTLYRLANDELYGNLVMPMEKVTIPRPPGVRNPMPHVIVGAPTTDPFRWILGFEDIPGGGDRDFNDVVFVINKQNGGSTRSATVSGDLSPDIANDFVITKVRFKRQDDFAPHPRTCTGGPPCFSEDVAGACTPEDGPEPTITYSLAVDCRICEPNPDTGEMECVPNPEQPTWFPVVFPETTPPTQEVELDIMSMGFTGSQLCWKVDITSPNELCRPIIDDVEVGYQAVRAGSYSRASPSTVGNAIVWGVNETPGSAWGRAGTWPGNGMPAPGVRAYDGNKDFTVRGRLHFRTLYDPENPVSGTAGERERWDAGRVMALSFGTSGSGSDPLDRKLFTMNASGNRSTISDLMTDTSSTSPLFPDALCDLEQNGRYLYDLNNDGKCGTPSITAPDKHVEGPANDRNFFREWLYGWEKRLNGSQRRPWALGGINMSTVAISVPPYLDGWALNARAGEMDLYRRNFMEPLAERPTVAYVGTMNGYLHAFDAGAFRNSTYDECLPNSPQVRGYFDTTGTCAGPGSIHERNYGSGADRFTYMPRMLLERYRNLYVRFNGSGNLARPAMDASPSLANVDFGINGEFEWKPMTSASKTEGAKTVLVSASGKNSPAVVALDITNPNDAWYPLPLWEFNLRDTSIDHAFSTAKLADPSVELPDNAGSSHAPSIGRLKWGSEAEGKWAAIVGTDYVPASPTHAGALYLIDLKTGQPLNFGASPGGARAGIITLDRGSGIAAETALVDIDRDGNYDVMYVPTTAGSVYRINLDQVSPSAPLGRKVKTCRIASAPSTLASHPDAATGQDPIYQQIHSNLGVNVLRNGGSPVVRFYFGTGDNPDEFSDGPPNKDSYRYHLLAFEDSDPTGRKACELLEPLWVQQLDPGQAVWGGVALAADKVYATTAVGAAADICNLSETESGRFYESGLLPDGENPPAMTSASLGGHAVNAPVVHDGHVIIPKARGDIDVLGDGTYNTGSIAGGAARSKVLIYAPSPDGRIQQ